MFSCKKKQLYLTPSWFDKTIFRQKIHIKRASERKQTHLYPLIAQ